MNSKATHDQDKTLCLLITPRNQVKDQIQQNLGHTILPDQDNTHAYASDTEARTRLHSGHSQARFEPILNPSKEHYD